MTQLFGRLRTGAALSIILVSLASVLLLPKNAQAVGETINGGAAVSGAPSTQIPISDLSVSTSGNPTIPIKLLVTSGTLSMTTTTGLTFTGGSTGSTLYFSGTLSNINAALATLRYTRASTGSDTLEMSLVESGEVFFPDNGHLYEYVSSTLDWNGARTAALGRTKYGAAGYLATVTSSSENSFIAARLLNAGWMGASDASVEGAWRWVTGPENGTQFWSGLSGGSTVGGQYSSWNGGEPNDSSSNEDCAQYLSGGGLWNDLPCSGSTLPGYVVEYGIPGGLPSVASKNVSVTVTNTSISGTVYASNGITNLGAGKHVNILRNGTTVGTPTTNASGQYSLAGVSLSAEDIVTVFLDGDAEKGVTVLRSNGASASSLNIWQNTLIARSASATALSNANLATANSSDSDITAIYEDSSSALNVSGSNNFYVPTSNSVAVGGGGVGGNTRIDGTLTISSSASLNVSGNLMIGGTVTGTDSNIFFLGTGTQTITSTGTISVGLMNFKSAGTLQFLSNVTITGSNWFALYNTGLTDCNNFALTAPNFDLNDAATYSCSSGNVTVGDAMDIRTDGGVFNVGSGTIDINGNLSITGGVFTASSGNTYIGGHISHSSPSQFLAPSGTVTLDGTVQAIYNDIAFHNLTIADGSNDSSDHFVSFADGVDVTITGTFTANGLDSNDTVRLTRDTVNWGLVFSGAGSAFTGDNVMVSGSDVTKTAGSNVSLPLNPASSYNAGNNSGWFGMTIAGTSHGAEPATAATFTISTNGTNLTGADIPISISYGGTATGGSDYTVATAILLGNQNSVVLSVPVLDDTLVEDTETIIVTLVSASGYTPISPSNASRNITSNDSGSISVSAPSGLLAEGDSRVISISLGAQPGADVILDIASNNTSNITVNKTSLTFTTSNWNVAQTVTASSVRDYAVAGGRSATVSITPSSGSPIIWQAVSPQTLGITIGDNDQPNIVIDPLSMSLKEGSNATATIVLGTNITTGTMVITATPGPGLDLGNGSGVAVDYTFNAGSHTLSSPLSLTATNNSLVDGARSVAVTFVVKSSNDPAYSGMAITETIKVAIADDERLAVTTASEESEEELAVDTTAETNDDGSRILLNDFVEYGDTTGKPATLGAGQVVYFNVIKQDEKEEHSVTVNVVADTYVDVTIASTPQQARLFIGDVKQFDVDKDGHNDIEISLHGIKSGLADLTFRQLAVEAAAVTATAKSPWSWIPWLIIITCAMLILYTRRRQQTKDL